MSIKIISTGGFGKRGWTSSGGGGPVPAHDHNRLVSQTTGNVTVFCTSDSKTGFGGMLTATKTIDMPQGGVYGYANYELLKAQPAQSNLFFGNASGNFSATGTENVALGDNALSNLTTGTGNIAIGQAALNANTGGQYNVSIGYVSSQYAENTIGNVSIGKSSLNANTSGGINTAIGYNSLAAMTSGNQNTAIGANALNALTSDSYNVSIGGFSGTKLTSGSGNVFIGRGAGNGATQKTDAVNSIAIGYATDTTADNQTVLGNTSITSCHIRGDISLDYGASTFGELKNGVYDAYISPFTFSGLTIASGNAIKIHANNSSTFVDPIFITSEYSNIYLRSGSTSAVEISSGKLTFPSFATLAQGTSSNFQIFTDTGKNIDIYSTTGDVQITGNHGNVEIISNTGNVLLTANTGGDMTLLTESGTLSIKTNTGLIELKTNTSGNILLNANSGNATITVSSGNGFFTVNSGSLSLTANAHAFGQGNIDLMSTDSGNINIGTEDGSLDIFANTGSLAIYGINHAGVDIYQSDQGDVTLYATSGDVNIYTETGSVSIENTNGNISITANTSGNIGLTVENGSINLSTKKEINLSTTYSGFPNHIKLSADIGGTIWFDVSAINLLKITGLSTFTDNATAVSGLGGVDYLYRNGDNVCITHS
jgi:hypothetical protein